MKIGGQKVYIIVDRWIKEDRIAPVCTPQFFNNALTKKNCVTLTIKFG